MTIRQRAVHAADKRERRHAILDATERLLGIEPERSVSMADVADEAGLAKGTVYLYFASKEELLLALHERYVEAFFRALIARTEDPGPLTIADLLALARAHIIAPPLALPLAARCFGNMAHAEPSVAARGFRERLRARIARAGGELERRCPELGTGGGAALLRHSYALTLGLWQMSAARPGAIAPPPARAGTVEAGFESDLEHALRMLWSGMVDARPAGRRS